MNHSSVNQFLVENASVSLSGNESTLAHGSNISVEGAWILPNTSSTVEAVDLFVYGSFANESTFSSLSLGNSTTLGNSTGGYSPTMSEVLWVDWLGFFAQGSMAVIGTILNGFIARVLFGLRQRTAMDMIQMNWAICDLIEDLFGPSSIILSRIIIFGDLESRLARKLTLLSYLFSFASFTFEELAIIFMLILRTKQAR